MFENNLKIKDMETNLRKGDKVIYVGNKELRGIELKKVYVIDNVITSLKTNNKVITLSNVDLQCFGKSWLYPYECFEKLELIEDGFITYSKN